jgi:siroheme synthase-like protein
VGAGPVAVRKVKGLLEAGSNVRVVAPETVEELPADDAVTWLRRPYRDGDLDGAAIVFAATGVADVDERVAAAARAAGVPVSVAGAPALGDFTTPAVVRRGELLVAVATSGRTPGLAGALRRRLDDEFGPGWADLVELLGAVRDRLPPAADRSAWDRLLDPGLLTALRHGGRDAARAELERRLGGAEPGVSPGRAADSEKARRADPA